MVTVLQRNLGVEYNPESMTGPADCTDSRSLFLHGLLETGQGTCLSMPVLYVAIARRLGYPVFLVGAKQHLFARWEGDGERFNIECTTRSWCATPMSTTTAGPCRSLPPIWREATTCARSHPERSWPALWRHAVGGTAIPGGSQRPGRDPFPYPVWVPGDVDGPWKPMEERR